MKIVSNNEMKLSILEEILQMSYSIKDKIKVLHALDQDKSSSGCCDLHDQISTFNNLADNLGYVIDRSVNIVPKHEGWGD